MKNFNFKKTLILLLFLAAVSCSSDMDDKQSILGTWIETAPVPERTTLHFGENSHLTRIDGNGNAEAYRYRIEEHILYLSLASGQEGASELIFEQINENRIKVENLYPSQAEPAFIIFDRYR